MDFDLIKISIELKFHFVPQVCFPGVSWQYSNIGSDNGLAPNRQHAIIWTNDALGCQRIYASLGLNESTKINVYLLVYGGEVIPYVNEIVRYGHVLLNKANILHLLRM